MIRLAPVLALFALAGCPKKQPATTTTTQQPAAGCPAGAGVYVASYVTQDPAKGRSGWVVPLHALKVEPNTSVPEYSSIDAATAGVQGVPELPTGTVWLVSATGQPCRAKVGGYYQTKLAGPPAGISYGFELEGCPAPQDANEGGGILLVSEQPPTGCRFEVPQPAAARLGEMDAKKQWQRPTKETPIPPALAAAIPSKECKAPSCEMLWAFGEVKVADQTVAWTGAVNWLQVGAPADQCKWPSERFSGFFVPSGGGAAQVTDGQEHPIVLSAVLADTGGAKVLLAEGPGAYATYDLAAGGAKLARAVTWMLVPVDAWDSIDHIGPICEREPAKPAPLPKSAKPQSPY
jgi:hypothetical protein